MSTSNEENQRATIAELVAADSAAQSDFFRPSSAGQSDIASGQPGLDSVPVLERLRMQDMLVDGSRLGPEFADEYRRIKRPLLSNAFGKTASIVDRGNLILVTSSIPGEGKTHTAVNLALSIALERDHTVLLVDCDVTRQGVSQMLDLEDKPGLVDVLEDENLTLGDAILRTDIPQLSILSAGMRHEFVTERRLAGLVNEMVSRYDDRVIVFDGPPLLPTPQTQVLAGLVGQIVLVIEAGKTPQAVVEDALELIPDEKAIGLVMNKSEGVSERSGYYYGYYGPDHDKGKTKSHSADKDGAES